MSTPGAFIFGCEGPELAPEEAEFFAGAQPWGFILFARNIIDPAQLRRLTTDLRMALGRNAPILIDQEGGRVQRMGPPHWTAWQPPLDELDRLGGGSATRAAFLRARIIAEELRAVGIDTNCAPLGDIATPDTHAVLRNRCYGTDAATVTDRARAVAEGSLAGGVLPVMKHMPGHGRSVIDTHLALPRVTTDAKTLQSVDFAPFRALSDLPIGMSAHLVFEAFDRERPATISPVMIDLIREAIGFSGLLMTDDISMQALSGSVSERGQAALAAGCDLVLHCNGDMAEMVSIAATCGQMSAAALARSDAALSRRHSPPDVDIDGLRAEFAALTGALAPQDGV